MNRKEITFTESEINRMSRDMTDVLRITAIISRRLERNGLPRDATVSDMAEYLDTILAELERRRAAEENKFFEEVYALSLKYGFGYKGLTNPRQLLDILEDEMKTWAMFRKTMRNLGQQKIIDQIIDAMQSE